MTTTRVGMLTPSSNTALEPETYRMIQAIHGVSAHFSRLRVEKMTLEAESDRQFESAVMLDVARLLEDARVDVLAWNGTAGSWLGPNRDRQMCSDIASTTGVIAIDWASPSNASRSTAWTRPIQATESGTQTAGRSTSGGVGVAGAPRLS